MLVAMIKGTNEIYDSERWSAEIKLSVNERHTVIRALTIARDFYMLMANVVQGHEEVSGRPKQQVYFLIEADRLLDRLKYAEKE